METQETREVLRRIDAKLHVDYQRAWKRYELLAQRRDPSPDFMRQRREAYTCAREVQDRFDKAKDIATADYKQCQAKEAAKALKAAGKAKVRLKAGGA